MSFGHVTKHSEMLVSESPINQIYSDSQKFAQTIINSDIGQPFDYEKKDGRRKSINI